MLPSFHGLHPYKVKLEWETAKSCETWIPGRPNAIGYKTDTGFIPSIFEKVANKSRSEENIAWVGLEIGGHGKNESNLENNQKVQEISGNERTQAGFQIDAFTSGSDWLICETRTFDWLREPSE